MMSSRILRVAVMLPLVALISFALQTTLLADMTVIEEVTTTVGDSKTTFTQTTYWTKGKMRTHHPMGMIMITDLDKKTITVVDPNQKTYMPSSFEDLKKMEAALPPEMTKMDFSVKETGEKKTIDGYPCEKLAFSIGPAEVVVWVTKKIAIDPAVTEFGKKFMKLTGDVKSLNLQAQMQAAYEKRKAYPYLTIMEMALPLANKVQRTESKVKKVSYDKIDRSVFAIPAGYKKTGLPQVPPQE